ncbi:hypothetical protein F53441_12194 [Fusarium austroafricanum]|uniref:Apple domain-containing protein n=1 Tax=Fusarium austroafricanum TaxID=2364996 RepID=A0A8H4JZC4_9HYPO|nr:hypothetical protein F53441_12194 [Fusarium austroafricanum]
MAAVSSTKLTNNPASSTVLSAMSSDALGETTLSTVGIFTTTSPSTSMLLSLDSTLTRSSDTTLAYGSSASTDPSSPASTSALFSSVEEVPSSDTSTTGAAAPTSSNTPDFVSSTPSATTHASSTTSDSTTTSTETYSQITKETETSTSHAASLSEDTSSVTTSDQASAGIETSTVETSTAQESTASTTEAASTTTTTIAEPNEPTNYFLNGGFEVPDEGGEYTGAPSLLGNSVTIKTDSLKALSGSHYAEVAFPLVGPGPTAYAIRQSIMDLDPAKRYAYTYNYAPADMVASGNPPNPIIKFTTSFGTKIYETDFRGEVSPLDSYVERKIVFDGFTYDFVQTQVQFSGLNRGSVRFDDISIFEYDPPCTLISPTPSDKWCHLKGSVYSASNTAKRIGTVQSVSLEDCAQSCHLESTCQVISYVPVVGNNIGRCWRYKVPREDIEYFNNGGGHSVYEPECFSFKE